MEVALRQEQEQLQTGVYCTDVTNVEYPWMQLQTGVYHTDVTNVEDPFIRRLISQAESFDSYILVK